MELACGRLPRRKNIETPRQAVETFEWQNGHYKAECQVVMVQCGWARPRWGIWSVSDEQGDTYSDELGERRDICRPTGPLMVAQQHKQQSVVQYDCKLL